MGFKVERSIPWKELEPAVRRTPLLNHRDIHPYADAQIDLREVAYSEVNPTSLYVLRANLALQAALANDIQLEGYNQLELEGSLVIRTPDGELVELVPPIVERTEKEGAYIIDGAHRTNMGRWLGRTSFVAIFISGIREDCPPYAFPNDWEEVKIREEVPTDPTQKKRYREADYKRLYRDFSDFSGSRGASELVIKICKVPDFCF